MNTVADHYEEMVHSMEDQICANCGHGEKFHMHHSARNSVPCDVEIQTGDPVVHLCGCIEFEAEK